MNERESYGTFHVDDLYLGVEVRRVQEVIRYQPMTRVPLAQKVVKGLMNLRGQIVTALDLRTSLQLPPIEDDREQMNVVVRARDHSISLLVDAIGDVVEVDQADFEPPPETLQGVPKEMIRGAFKMDGRLLLILNTDRVTEVAA